MLIVATPRSASTSFAHTVAEVLGVNDIQIFGQPKLKKTAKAYPQLSAHHSDCREWTKDIFTGNDVFKQHIPPTESNLNLIGSNYALLIRDPAEIMESYRRLGKTFDESKTREELNRFIWGHINNTPRVVLSFGGVVNNTRHSLYRIMDAYGYDKVIGDVKLAKLRYSR